MRTILCFLSVIMLHAGAYAQLYGKKPDYGDPALYLKAGPQSSVSMPAAALRAEIGLSSAPRAGELVAAVYKWMSAGFKASEQGGRLIGKTTADGLLKRRELSGCHDWALLFSSVLRRLGYPALLVDAAGIKWAGNFKGGGSYSGHVFAEVYVEDRWMLVDAVSGRYVEDYDPSNPVIPMPVGAETEGLYAMFKGPDPESYGIGSNEELREKMKDFAARLPKLELKPPKYKISFSGPAGPAASLVSEGEVTGECRQGPCRRHPATGAIMQTADWDLHLEKKDGAYHAHHYPKSRIFTEKEVKDLEFATLGELNGYLEKISRPAFPQVNEEDAAGECRQTPCLNHPCKGTVIQVGGWDMLVEKKDGEYHVHHYRRSFIFMEAEVKDMKFQTLKALNKYLAGTGDAAR